MLTAAKVRPVLQIGPLPTRMMWYPTVKPTLKIALDAMTEGMSIRGGKSNGAGSVIAASGFSSNQSEQVRHMCFMVSAALALIDRKHKVQIDVDLGTVLPVYQAMTNWGKKLITIIT